MKKNVLFLDKVHPVLKERLEKMGMVCLEDFTSTGKSLFQKLENIEGIVIRSRITIDKEFIDKAKSLKFIARSGSGLENIDTEYAAEKGINCLNSPEGNRSAVAEHVIGMLLALFNHLKTADYEVRKGMWEREKNRGLEIEGRTVGIIGYGNTGGALAKKLSGFDCRILVYDKYKKDIRDSHVKSVDIEELQNKSDIISLHLPLNKETRHIVNHSFIEQLKDGVYLVNASRGQIADTSALANGLRTGKINGMCLDVLEKEKTSFEKLQPTDTDEDLNYLLQSEKVLLSPHVAGWTKESYYKLSSVLADKIASLYQDN